MYETTPQPTRPRRSLGRVILAVVLGLLCGVLVFRLVDRFTTPPPEPRTITPRGELAAVEKTTIELFQNAAPAVVYITNVALRRDFWRLNVMEIPQGAGSGFIWDSSGHIGWRTRNRPFRF